VDQVDEVHERDHRKQDRHAARDLNRPRHSRVPSVRAAASGEGE
jgi:hypothetical protein